MSAADHLCPEQTTLPTNTNQIQLRFRRASNIDFCRTSFAIVKVLGGQGGHFGTNLGPKRHPPERWNSPLWGAGARRWPQVRTRVILDSLAHLVACNFVFSKNFLSLSPQAALWCPTLATSSAEGVQTSIFEGPPLQLSRFWVA